MWVFFFFFLIGKKNFIKKKLLHQRNEVNEGNIYKQQRKTKQLMYNKKVNLKTLEWISKK